MKDRIDNYRIGRDVTMLKHNLQFRIFDRSNGHSGGIQIRFDEISMRVDDSVRFNLQWARRIEFGMLNNQAPSSGVRVKSPDP